jgi:hypothetical protein
MASITDIASLHPVESRRHTTPVHSGQCTCTTGDGNLQSYIQCQIKKHGICLANFTDRRPCRNRAILRQIFSSFVAFETVSKFRFFLTVSAEFVLWAGPGSPAVDEWRGPSQGEAVGGGGGRLQGGGGCRGGRLGGGGGSTPNRSLCRISCGRYLSLPGTGQLYV